jgi:tyrosinase
MANTNAAWAQCQHGSYFFLSWHRMYLYFFERILRAATGDNTFALPYWNYSDPTDLSQRALPIIFRQPANSTTNPLFTASRNTQGVGMNNGARLTASAVSTTKALNQTTFTNSVGAGSFGGQTVGAPVHFNGGFGELESTPHNVIHDQVGGSSGLMSDPDCAARDPVFWFHHSNIDRLWDIWLAQGGRKDPVADKTWTGQKFTFFDEKKVKHTMTACDILNAQAQLGYSYEGEPTQVTQKCVPPSLLHAAQPRRPARLITRSAAPRVDLGTEPTTVPLKLPAPNKPLFSSVLTARTRPERIYLHVEGLQVTQHPGVIYEVYVNLPPGTTDPDPEGPNHVGNLTFFGFKRNQMRMHRGARMAAGTPQQSFDITDVVRGQQDRGAFDPNNISVTFVPRGTDEAEGGRPQTLQLAEKPHFAKLSITIQ